jgi:hypothetical protein
LLAAERRSVGQHSGNIRELTMRLISFLVFLVLQIVFVPIAIVGAVLVGYKQMVISKRLEVSQAGIEILNGRWAMHVFDIRQDLAAVELRIGETSCEISRSDYAMFC